MSTELSRYLRSVAYLPADLQEVLRDCLADRDQAATFLIDPQVAERFRDCFTERLAQAGFDGDYKLSAEGTALEELIDRFAG